MMALPVVDLTLGSSEEAERCPICGELLPLAQLPAHCDAHFSNSSQPEVQQLGYGGSSSSTVISRSSQQGPRVAW